MIKIFHCADIHLDAPFAAETPENAAQSRSLLRSTFADMVSAAKEKQVDLFLICGDLFDREFVTGDTTAFLREQFASAPAVRFVIQPGNHDPYTDTSAYRKTDFGKNVFLFTREEGEIFRFDDLKTVVAGYAFHSPKLDRPPFPAVTLAPDEIGIMMLHGSLDAPEDSTCVFTQTDLIGAGYDYYPMGHYHNTDGLHRAGKAWYGYSGCPQGRDFGECGKKGAVYAEAEKKDGRLTFTYEQIPFCSHRYEIVRCNLTGCADREAVFEAVKAVLMATDYRADTAVRLIAQGAVAAGVRVPAMRITETFRPLYYDLEITDRTTVLPDGDLENDPTLRGAFYDALRDELNSDNDAVREQAMTALRIGLAVLDGSDPEF